jgi:adenine-specific DNA-methyltransferase
VRLGETVDELVADPSPGRAPGFVERTFAGVFFEDEENRFIDAVLERIARLDGHRRDIALYALFQAALAKRPYNLFHRANLYMRRRKVERSFGNKTTWETPFSVHIRRNAAEADAAIFDNGRPCRALRADVLEIDPTGYDLVYLDPPYVSATGKGVDYLDYYHFLEGLCAPEGWGDRILHRYKHKPLVGRGESPWTKPAEIGAVFERAIAHYRASTLVISYRADGIPTVDEISAFLARAGKRITIIDSGKYTYALSRNRRSREIVLIGA